MKERKHEGKKDREKISCEKKTGQKEEKDRPYGNATKRAIALICSILPPAGFAGSTSIYDNRTGHRPKNIQSGIRI